MKNRKTLHDYGIVMILFGVIHLVLFIATIVSGIVDGSVAAALADVQEDILLPVKITLGVIFALLALLVFADVLLGIKAIKISKRPKAHKGYIVVAVIFFILTLLSVASHVNALIGGQAPIVDTVLNLVSAVASAVLYFLFILVASAVRRDVINGTK